MVARIHLKHAREPAAVDEGKFSLVARIWPRGVSKEELQLAARLKEVVPSTTLRRRYLNESGSLPGAPPVKGRIIPSVTVPMTKSTTMP
ncbi:hypothetical protein [Luteolibacter luteus]|uniref:DUF488 family protein, N3 subclade n=1 Tax=Luteolibacter luteus TaxID=2728835 RepID=UPI003CCD4228